MTAQHAASLRWGEAEIAGAASPPFFTKKACDEGDSL
jgi:hypothetical protein